MSVDADRLVNLCLSFHELWSLPAQIGIALWLLYTQVCSAPYSSWCVVFSKAGLNRDATKHKGTCYAPSCPASLSSCLAPRFPPRLLYRSSTHSWLAWRWCCC
jgi:hypothetical protein